MSKLNRCNTDIIVAIDPDVEKNGVARLSVLHNALEINSLRFPHTLDYLYSLREFDKQVTVIIEAGWLNKSHWHLRHHDSSFNAAAKGNAVGRNHEVGRKLAEMCEHWGLNYRLVKPLPLTIGKKHLWHGKDGKITAQDLQALTGYNKRTNQEGRDAALLAWVSAGYNFSTKTKQK